MMNITVMVTTAVLEDEMMSYEEAVLDWAVPLDEAVDMDILDSENDFSCMCSICKRL